MRNFIVALFLLVPTFASAQNYLRNLIGKTAAEITEMEDEVTNLDSAYFTPHLGTNFVDITAAILQGRAYSALDYASLAAALTAMRTAGGNPLIIPGSYVGSALTLTAQDSQLVIHDYRYGKESRYGLRRWGFGGVVETDSLTRLKKVFDSLATNGKIKLGKGSYSVGTGLSLTSPFILEGTGTQRSNSQPTFPFYPGSAITSSGNLTTQHALTINTTGVDIRDLTVIGNNRTSGHGLYVLPSGSTTRGDVYFNGVSSMFNGQDGFRVVSGDGISLVNCDANRNLGYGIALVDGAFNGTGTANGIANIIMHGRTRDNSAGGILLSEMNTSLLLGAESIRDSVTNMSIIGGAPASTFSLSPVLIAADAEFAPPRSSDPTAPSYNLYFKKVRNATIMNSKAGSLHHESSTYVADAGTNTTTIVDAALIAGKTNYYVGWYVENTTRASTRRIVTAYNSTTKTLTISPAIASQTTGDVYDLFRPPNAVVRLDSVDHMTFINNNFGYSPGDTAVSVRNFANTLWIGGMRATNGNFDPDSNIYVAGAATNNWAQVAIDRLCTSGEFWLRTNRRLLVRSTDGVVSIQGEADNAANHTYFNELIANDIRPNVRFYFDANTAASTLSRKYMYLVSSSSQNNRMTFEGSDDSVSVGIGNPWVLTGDDQVARYTDIQASNNKPETFALATNYLRLYAFQDKAWTYDDNGDTLNITPYSANATWNPGDLADAAIDSTTIAVTNAAVGDVVACGHSGITTANGKIQLWGHVVSAGSVRMYARNVSGGTYNIPSGTAKVRVWK